MVLEHLGRVKTEEELRALTDSAFDSIHFPGGTTALLLVEAAKQLGFSDSAKHNLNLQELLGILKQGFFPIVYIGIRLQPAGPVQRHAVVVVEISEQGVLILDPQRGEVTHSIDEFNAMWELMRGLTILIKIDTPRENR